MFFSCCRKRADHLRHAPRNLVSWVPCRAATCSVQSVRPNEQACGLCTGRPKILLACTSSVFLERHLLNILNSSDISVRLRESTGRTQAFGSLNVESCLPAPPPNLRVFKRVIFLAHSAVIDVSVVQITLTVVFETNKWSSQTLKYYR